MKLYIYEHCPYCAKALMIFGFKSIRIETEILLNDDEDTPNRMIGRKAVPILQKSDGTFMPESLDIIHYIDQNFEKPIIKAIKNPDASKALHEWLKTNSTYIFNLFIPRVAEANFFEFSTASARHYFISKKTKMIGDFSAHLRNSAEYINTINQSLIELENIVEGDYIHGELTIDDFHLFAQLRSLSIVQGIEYPPKINNYCRSISEKAQLSLFSDIAV